MDVVWVKEARDVTHTVSQGTQVLVLTYLGLGLGLFVIG